MENFKEWWNEASTKDQIYLLVCAICVVLYILYMAVYSPVKDMRDSSAKQVTAQLANLEEIKQLAAQLKASKQQGGNRSGPSLDSDIQGLLAKHGIRANQLDASGRNGVRVRLEDAAFETFVAWLYEVEVTKKYRVKDMSVTSGSAPGSVNVSLRLERESK